MQRRTLAFAFYSLGLGLALSFVVGSARSLAAAQPTASTYTVVSGDTLWSISERFHVSVSQLVRMNHLRDANALSLGELLQISVAPREAPPRTKHGSRAHNRKVVAARHTRPARTTTKSVSSPAALAEMRALWVATHSAGAPPSLLGSFSVAEHIIVLEAALTQTALRYIGVPYEWGGESFYGVDCSGFVQAVFRHNGIELPRTADAQFEVGERVIENDLRPGDLVFFQTYTAGASHVGIYLGGGRFVHASASDGVRVDSLSDDYYASRYLGARREAI